jgi:hypothetical protein
MLASLQFPIDKDAARKPSFFIMIEKNPMQLITTLARNLNRAGPISESVINRQLSKESC